MRLFRAMKIDGDGLPAVESSARGLGARPNIDVPVVEGYVSAGTGGMSVTLDDAFKLPRHRLPARLGGEGRDPVFHLEARQLPPALAVRRDAVPAEHHGLVEPTVRCTFIDYQSTIQSTRHHWTLLS